jgi:hypothetical protein
MVYILYPDTDVDNKLVKPTLNDAVLKFDIFIITIPDPPDAAAAGVLGLSFLAPPPPPPPVLVTPAVALPLGAV